MQCQDDNSNQFWLTPEGKTATEEFFYICSDRYIISSKVYKIIQDRYKEANRYSTDLAQSHRPSWLTVSS